MIKKKEIIKIIIFILLAALMLWYSSLVLGFPIGEEGYTREKHNEFRTLPDDSLDALFIGSSSTDRFWIPSLGWAKAGITSFDYCSNGAPIILFPEMIEEALKYQSPKVIVIEIKRVCKNTDAFEDYKIRRITNNLVRGETKQSVIDKSFYISEKYLGEETTIDVKDKSWQYSYLRNHNRWKNGLKAYEFYNLYPKTAQMGYSSNFYRIWTSVDLEEPEIPASTMELDEYQQESLDVLLDYCDTLDCEVVFLSTPAVASEEQFKCINKGIEIVKERGYKVIDLNSDEALEEYGISYETDFYNERHTNFSGAVKTTNAILDYFEANYEMPDHKGDAKYEEKWNALYQDLVKLVKENRPEWLDLINE